MAGVKTTHPDYDRYSRKWKRVRDVVAGQDAMHDAGEAYLAKLKGETHAEYKERLKRSDFFNGTWRTIDALSGMAFRKPPTVDVPAAIESYLDDVTLSGVSMEAFARDALEEDLSVSRLFILVDHPLQPENVTALTVEAAQRLGLRPTLQLYTAESIRNWKFARVDNAWVLSMVVLGEQAAVAEDEFTEKMEDRYRVLDLAEGVYRQRVFKVDKDGKDELLSEVFPLMNNKPLSYIPGVLVGANGKGDQIDEPALIDLVDKNIAHYQVNADYRHGAHFTAMPTLFLAGVQNDDSKDPIYIGGSAAITSPAADARGEFIEYKGQGLGAIEKMLDRIERQMAMLGARMIADESKQAETLGATQIKRSGENSVLAKIVQSVSEALEWALTVFAEWAGQAGSEIVYQLNRDFTPTQMDAQQLTSLLGAVQAGELSSEEFFVLLQRGDLVDGSKTFEEHQAQTEIQGPSPARPDAAPASDVGTAVTDLEAAIARHERHMNGTEPTSDASQMKMMTEMKAALAALKGGKGKPKSTGMAM